MRILMLTQWFEPEPTFKGLMFAQELQRHGHEVEVLTGFPNYPGGRLYPGYRLRPWAREVVQGVPVVRVALYPSHDQSGVRRALNYLSFAASATVVAPFLRRPDVAYVYHPPATVALPATVLKVLRGVPFVYDVQDLWPDTLAATGMVRGRRLLGAADRVMRAVYGQAQRVVVLSHGFRAALQERGVPADKVTVIRNWNAEDQLRPAGATPAHPTADPAAAPAAPVVADRPFRVVFAGNLGRAQALEAVIEAARVAPDDVEFVFVGSGVAGAGLVERTEALGLGNVRFLPRRPTHEMAEVFAEADALLVHLRDDPLFAMTIPSKTQAYLMAGRPILIGVAGEAADLVEAAGAGIAFEPEDAAGLVAAIARLRSLTPEERDQMGARGQAYYDRHLSLAVGARQFVDALEAAAYTRRRFDRLKRGTDVVGSLAALAVAAVPMAVVAAVVHRTMGSPAVFRQERPGRHGHPFTMLKFRTMTDARGADGMLLPDADRLTALGRFLRLTSLDELPELVNVLRGEMSLVGPRPLLTRYSPFFTDTEARRLEVRPGITGLAQVRGRNHASWDDRLAMDTWYVEHMGPVLDLRLMAATVGGVLRRGGVVVDPESIMLNLDDERRLRLEKEPA